MTHRDDVMRDIPSMTLSSTHVPMMLSVACHQRPRAAQTVLQCPVCHAINSFDITYGQSTSGVACHHCLWAKHLVGSGVACNHIPWSTHTVEKSRAFHAIVAFGIHTNSDDVWNGMPACPLGSKHCQTISGKAFHHRLWTTDKVR